MDHTLVVRLRVYLALVVVAVGLYLLGQWQGARRVGDLLVTQQAQTGLNAGKSYRAFIAKLLALEQRQAALAGTWRHRADSLRARAVRVDTLVTSDSGPVRLWRATANAEHETARICAGTLQTCQERAQAAMSRAASLDSLLGNVLKIRDCHILFVKCPSRMATGLLGLGLGFAGSLLVTR